MVLIIEVKNVNFFSGGERGGSPQIAILDLKTSNQIPSLGFFKVKLSQ